MGEDPHIIFADLFDDMGKGNGNKIRKRVKELPEKFLQVVKDTDLATDMKTWTIPQIAEGLKKLLPKNQRETGFKVALAFLRAKATRLDLV